MTEEKKETKIEAKPEEKKKELLKDPEVIKML